MQHLAQAKAKQRVVVGGDDPDHGVAPFVVPVMAPAVSAQAPAG
jgi:hypothetical protein